MAITATRTKMPSSEAELSPIDKLISEAYSEIDKAIVKVQSWCSHMLASSNKVLASAVACLDTRPASSGDLLPSPCPVLTGMLTSLQ